jgi:hypothetical protein
MPLANVFSVGDVLIGVGGAYFIFRTMHRAPVAHAAVDPRAQARMDAASHG